jgi:hypothetical protein
MMRAVDGVLAKSRIKLLTASAESGQFDAWRARRQPALEDYAQYIA